MSRWSHTISTVVALSILATGCIGSIDRSDFDAEVRARGGGVTSAWVAESLDVAAAELGVSPTDDVELLTLTINSPNRTVTVTARRGDRPDFVDSVIVNQGEVVAVSPMQDADQLPLSDITTRLGDLPIDQLERITDEALASFGETDGFVTSISMALSQGEPRVTFQLSSARQTGTATFDAAGNLLDVGR